ncbi:TPA: caspase family protein [Neisseria subflava]
MKRKALLIGNSNGLSGVKVDLERFESFLYSNIGGAWNRNEINILPNATSQELTSVLTNVKNNNVDYCIVYFSGHGGFERQTVLELSDKTIISENLLHNLSQRQLTIFDCCRSMSQKAIYESAQLSTEIFDLSKRSRDFIREKYNQRIMQSIPQQAKLYSCSIGEISNDTSKGGIYTQALLDAAPYAQTVGDVHNLAQRLVQTRWNNSQNEKQNPEAILPKCLTSQQLIFSLKLE